MFNFCGIFLLTDEQKAYDDYYLHPSLAPVPTVLEAVGLLIFFCKICTYIEKQFYYIFCNSCIYLYVYLNIYSKYNYLTLYKCTFYWQLCFLFFYIFAQN